MHSLTRIIVGNVLSLNALFAVVSGIYTPSGSPDPANRVTYFQNAYICNVYTYYSSKKDEEFFDSQPVIHSTGNILWMTSAIVETSCDIDITHFPHDEQNCTFQVNKNLKVIWESKAVICLIYLAHITKATSA